MIKLSNESLLLLKKCLEKDNTDLISIIKEPSIHDYTPDFYNQLREIVGIEFITNGLRGGYEPNKYGLKLEKLIDEIGRLFMYKNLE